MLEKTLENIVSVGLTETRNAIKTMSHDCATKNVHTVDQKNMIFMQTAIDGFARSYLVPVDPEEHKLIYENLLEFEKNNTSIEIYLPFHGSPKGDATTQAWTEFCHGEFVKSHYIESKACNLPLIAKARFWCWYTHISM